ncbi:substrate-binding domain-containing protein [Cytophagaceae bacterium ABcell3]|nr:substrate-binding domain-containing protein [Cytophagaceae bacterium ABcell3]
MTMHKVWYIIPFLLFLFSCDDGQGKKEKDSPVSGRLLLFADESFRPVVDAQAGTFQALYKDAVIQPHYVSETEAINSLLNRKTEVVVAGRSLTDKERNFFKESQLMVAENKIASDAVAFLVHKDSPLESLKIEQLSDIFSGTATSWAHIDAALDDQEIHVVFDQSGSANYRLLNDSLQFSKNDIKVFAAGSNASVVDYIHKHPEAIGVIGANWISDLDDPEVLDRLNHVKVLDIEALNSNGEYEVFSPFQSDLLSGRYPFLRDIYLINLTSRAGLPTGFASFVLSDRGQRIVLKDGLMPAVVPGREVHVVR